jgi:hypothetical protein
MAGPDVEVTGHFCSVTYPEAADLVIDDRLSPTGAPSQPGGAGS